MSDSYSKQTFAARLLKEFGIDITGAHLKLNAVSKIYLRAHKLLMARGINVRFEAFLPWRAGMVVSAHLMPKFGFFDEYGVDNQLRMLADTKKLSVDFFESRTRSSELMDDSCKKFQGGLAFFKNVITNAESGAGQLELQRMFRAWMSADLVAMNAILAKDFAKFPYIINVQHQRNCEWVTVAKRLITENIPTLFVVGALHTVGKGSFIEQMESAGFKFKFIP